MPEALEKVYYFDGSGFSTAPCVPYRWQRIGETRKIPSHRSKRMNVLGFLNRRNDLFFNSYERSFTTDTVVTAFDAFPKVMPASTKRQKCLAWWYWIMPLSIVATYSRKS
ncbi:MAG: transposase [Methylococcaceae bacterium]